MAPFELFRLANDPGERRDLALGSPLRRAWLEAQLGAVFARRGTMTLRETMPISPEMEESLRALGYL